MRTTQHAHVLQSLLESRLVPAVRTGTPEHALLAARALLAAGIKTLEIPLTVPGALKVITQLREQSDNSAVVGAGTVLTVAAAREAIESGAEFIVSPALNVEVIALCRSEGVPCLPGALSPTEVWSAWDAGADIVKVFPASAMGGPSYIRSLLASFAELRLMPMGGVSLNTAAEYIAAGAVALGVGQDLVDCSALDAGDAGGITARAQKYLSILSTSRPWKEFDDNTTQREKEDALCR